MDKDRKLCTPAHTLATYREKKEERREGEERKEEWRDKEERRRWMVEGKRV